MGKVLYSATASLDGFIAGPDGDMSWLTPYAGADPLVEELIRDVGALLIGHRTFTGDDPNAGTDSEGAFGGAWDGPQFVLSHYVPFTPPPGITFVGDLEDAVARATAAAGDGYVNVLGASVARQCLDAGLLDEVLILVAPVLLGDGTRIFDWPGGTNIALERIRVSTSPTTTAMWFRVPRQPA